MTSTLGRSARRLRYLVVSTGTRTALRRAITRLASPLYASQTLIIQNLYVDYDAIEEGAEEGPETVRGEIVETVEALAQRRGDLHPALDYDYLVRFITKPGRSRCVLFFDYTQEDGTHQIIGFRTIEQGYFEMPEYHFGGPLASNFSVVYEVEVAPSFRGKNIHGRTRRYLFQELRRRGVTCSTGVIRPHNAASLRASFRQTPGSKSTFNGSFRVSRWLGGRRVRTPSWDRVRALMESPPGPTTLPPEFDPGD
ncbi:MAG: hypothetical protein R3C39_08005 [Dehalococcoidia bacterium]